MRAPSVPTRRWSGSLPVRRLFSWTARNGDLLLMCALALGCGLHAVRGLQYPGDSDFYRDMGAAQSFLDGRWFSDPAYLGELRWYNPLAPFLVATLAKVTHLSLALLYARAGAWLNLLSPIAFYAMVSALFDRRTAIAATAGFLFFGPLDHQSWLVATYSPWYWPIHLAQAVFCLAIVAHLRAIRRDTIAGFAFSGFALGLVFLTENFGATILVLWVVLDAGVRAASVWRAGSPAGVRRIVARLFATSGIALVVALPNLAPAFLRYHGRVLNWAPGSWYIPEMDLEHLASMPRVFFANPRTLIALVGAFVLARSGRSPGKERDGGVAVRLLGTWAAVSVAYLAYSYFAFAAARDGRHWPSPIPSWHAMFWLKGTESVLFGCAFTWALTSLLRSRSLDLVQRLVLLFFVVARLPAYASSSDMTAMRNLALERQGSYVPSLYEWALANLKPEDVVLNTFPDMVTMSVVAADRQVVQAPDIFSNPYVDLRARADDAIDMYEAIDRRDPAAFNAIAKRYRVKYVLLPRNRREEIDHAPVPWLKRVYETPNRDSDAVDGYQVIAS